MPDDEPVQDGTELEPAGGRLPLQRREWDKPWKNALLVALATVPNVTAAARVAEISTWHVYRTMKQDPEFKLAVEEAKMIGVEILEVRLMRRAGDGEARTTTKTRTLRRGGEVIEEEVTLEEHQHISDTLGMFFLKRFKPEYRERFDVRHTGGDGGPIQHEIYRPITPERAEELLKLMAEEREQNVIEGEATEIKGGGDEQEE